MQVKAVACRSYVTQTLHAAQQMAQRKNKTAHRITAGNLPAHPSHFGSFQCNFYLALQVRGR